VGIRRRSFKFWLAVAASLILGMIFIIAGLGKMPQQSEIFALSAFLPGTFLAPILAKVAKAAFLKLPVVELTVGLLLIMGVATKIIATFSLALIAAFMANNSWLLSHGLRHMPCGCLGIVEESLLRGELSVAGALYLDIGMLALVLIILFCYPGNFLTPRPWFLRTRMAKDSTSKEVS